MNDPDKPSVSLCCAICSSSPANLLRGIFLLHCSFSSFTAAKTAHPQWPLFNKGDTCFEQHGKYDSACQRWGELPESYQSEVYALLRGITALHALLNHHLIQTLSIVPAWQVIEETEQLLRQLLQYSAASSLLIPGFAALVAHLPTLLRLGSSTTSWTRKIIYKSQMIQPTF